VLLGCRGSLPGPILKILGIMLLCYDDAIRDLTNNGDLVRIFVDTGANINTTTRDIYDMLVFQGFKSKFTRREKMESKLKW